MLAMLDVRSILKTRREQKTRDVFSLARQVAANQSVDADVLLASVTSAGMTDDDFLELVDMVRTRDELRRVAATQTAADQEARTLEDAIAKHREALDEAQAKYRKAVEPLELQLSEAKTRSNLAASARGGLVDPRNLPKTMVVELKAARENHIAAAAALEKTQRHIQRQTERVQAALDALEADEGFDKLSRRYDDEYRRQTMPFNQKKMIEDVRGGRYQVREAAEELARNKAAEEAARQALAAVEKSCLDF